MPQRHPYAVSPDPHASPALLLVDDESAFVDALAFRLRMRGIACLTACRGEEALHHLERRELEVVLLDLNMPGLHGLETLRRIKAKRPEVEVVLLTGEADFSVAARGMRRGAGDYLLKPVDFEALLESIAKATQRSREHKERLRAAEAGKLMALGALATGVGHELNNPLQIIMHRSEWLQELVAEAQKGTLNLAELVKTAEVIKRQAARAGEITAQLLDLAHRSRSGKAKTSLPKLIGKVLDAQRARAQALGCALDAEIDPGLPPLPCSPTELEPIFMHLVRNALDAVEALQTRGQRRSEPAAAGKATPCVAVTAMRRGTMAVISVRDTGEGVAREQEKRVFDPFFSTRPVGDGTGLGLTVCHSIITAMHGSIAFFPSHSGGAIFTVEIPLGPDGHITESKHGA